MNIALINRTFSLSHGGRERYAVNLARALDRAGCGVIAVGETLADLPEAISRVRISPARKPGWWGPLSLTRASHRILRGTPCDLTYGLSPCPPLDVYRAGDGVHAHWLRRKHPDFIRRWGFCLLRPVNLVNLYLERRLFGPLGCRRIVANSHLCRAQLQENYGVSAERIRVVYNGVDGALFSPEAASVHRRACRDELGLKETDVVALFVSNNWDRKGLPVLLEAVARLGNSAGRLHVVVLGRGRPGSYRSLAASMGLGDRLHLVGPVPSVLRFYGAGDFLVLPTRYDPFANVCLEAMACGLPVVTTAQNGAAELIQVGETGFVQAHPEDPRELAGLLEECLNLGGLASMGAEAGRSVRPFTLERNMRETLDVCHEVLALKQASSVDSAGGRGKARG